MVISVEKMDLRIVFLYIYISGNQHGRKGPFLRGWMPFLFLEQQRKRSDEAMSAATSTHTQPVLAVM